MLNTGRETTMARENLNLDVGTTNRVIPKAFADKFAATRDYEITKPKGFVYIGYDPHPGGPESMVGIHAATYDEGIHVIVSQDTFHSHNPADQIDAIMAMIRTICMFKVFASCVFVICPEANTIVHAKLLGEFVNSSACDDLRERLCMLHEVKSDPRRPGLCTTKEVNQCYQLRTLMQENRLRYWTGFFTTNKGVGEAGIKRIFRDQIDNYRYETAGSKKLSDVMTKDSKIVTTGKINGGHDDLLDSAEIACLAKFYFSMDSSKYNKYKMSDDY